MSFNDGFKTLNSREVGPKLEECILEDNDSHNKIAVVTVDGIITSHTADQAGNNMVDVIKAQLDRAKDDDRVKAVILKVDSPGGEVMASDQINKVIAKFQDGAEKPVICSMGSLAASGGYYISAPCRWIVANDLTLTASIGVIMEDRELSRTDGQNRRRADVYKSGKYKDMLSGMRETNEIPAGEHEMVQNLIDETYEKFKKVVARRPRTAAQKKITMKAARSRPTGQFCGRTRAFRFEALKLGFVDELGDFDDAVDRAEKIAHIGNANLVEYRERYDISDFLSMFGQSSKSHDIKLDLGMDVPKLQAGALYFLWQVPEN